MQPPTQTFLAELPVSLNHIICLRQIYQEHYFSPITFGIILIPLIHIKDVLLTHSRSIRLLRERIVQQPRQQGQKRELLSKNHHFIYTLQTRLALTDYNAWFEVSN